jgi:Flp pilus assembly protein TadD
LRIKPDQAMVHNNLGLALHTKGNTADAITHFRQALRIQPDQARTHYVLGMALEANGEIPAAMGHYLGALDLQPNSPHPLNRLAWIRATHPEEVLRNGAQAVEWAERCCKLTGYKVAGFLDTLAAAYAEAGRFDDAIRWQTKAVEIAPAADKADLNSRLKLYKVGKPYRDKP